MTIGRDRVAQALPAYVVGEELGQGAFGIVWSGEHRRMGRRVAIKQLVALDAGVRARFLDEAKVLASLDHPHVVPLYDYVEDGDVCLLVMERLDGGTLGRRFSLPRRVDIASSCAVAMVTCSGLHHAHRRGVLHRDIKPDNLLFSAEGILKVTDFGIAKVAGGGSHVTALGELKGTPAYMAPEQVAGRAVGPGVDIYATGLLLYELLCGRLPFSGEGQAIAVAFRRLNEEPRPLADIAPDLPGQLTDVTMQALSRLPEDRFASAQDFGVAIGRAASTALGAGWLDDSHVELLAPGPILDSAHLTGRSRITGARPAATVIASPGAPDVGEPEAPAPEVGRLTKAAPAEATPLAVPPAAVTAATPSPSAPPVAVTAAMPPVSPSQMPPAASTSPSGAGGPAGPVTTPFEAPVSGGHPTTGWPDVAAPTRRDRAAPATAATLPSEVAGWGYSAVPLPGPDRPGGSGRRMAIIGAVVALVVVGGAVAVALGTKGGGGGAGTSTTAQPATTVQGYTGASATSAPTSAATTAATNPEQVAATQLASLLQQSNGARNSVVTATQAVGGCQENPRDGIAQVQTGITEREAVINNLGTVPVSSLTNGSQMVGALNQALQASVEADRHFIDWMTDIQNAGSCPIPNTDPAFQAASAASKQATTAKQSFVGYWNPVAAKYGLTQYAEKDL